MNEKLRKIEQVTIKDVAREAGVSISTVSRVVNNYEYVRPQTREKVQSAIARLDYVVNQQARNLVRGRSPVIGLLVPDVGNTYIGTVMRGIDVEVAAAHFDLMLYTTRHGYQKESHYVATLTQGLTSGLLLLVPRSTDAYIKTLVKRKFPFVVIDHQSVDDFSATVVAANCEGAFNATSYLINLGHRRIGHIAGDQRLSSGVDRLNGYRAALEKHDIPFDPVLVVEGFFEQSDSCLAANTLLDLPAPPTAIFAASDMSAFGAMDAIRHRGLHLPEDISIVGFDDIPEARYMHPALTTVRQPLYDMGRYAAHMLVEAIVVDQLPTMRIVVDTELIIRDSCRPPQ